MQGGGLSELSLGQVDLKGGKVQVVEKRDKARPVLFAEEPSHAVRAWLGARPFPGCNCFLTLVREGRAMTDWFPG